MQIFFFLGGGGGRCTFNLKHSLYLLDINVLPFLIGFYSFVFLFFRVTDCSVRTEMYVCVGGSCVHGSGGCCFSGARLSQPLVPFSPDIY